MINKLKQLAAKARNASNRMAYRRWACAKAIDEHAVLLDQQHGLTADGNLHYIARELADESRYGTLEAYFTVNRHSRAKMARLLELRGLDVTPVIRSSRRYYKLLATAKHLVADTSFPPVFAKRDGQVYWNTWHGTPLKTLGVAEKAEAHLIGNVQKNLAEANYLSFPNEFSAERITEDYRLRELGTPVLLLGEYPRNEAFAQKAGESERARFIPKETRAYAYLPTFRFSTESGSKDAGVERIAGYLTEIDSSLEDDELFFVKLHPAIGKTLDLASFEHIKPVPDDVELYRFLNLCDALVTDYSSVMFDFAITRRKIVLFTFDEESYLADRGLYLPLADLPFPQVKDIESLLCELRTPKTYDDGAFLERFAPYPADGTTERLCRRVFNGEGGLVDEKQL